MSRPLDRELRYVFVVDSDYPEMRRVVENLGITGTFAATYINDETVGSQLAEGVAEYVVETAQDSDMLLLPYANLEKPTLTQLAQRAVLSGPRQDYDVRFYDQEYQEVVPSNVIVTKTESI